MCVRLCCVCKVCVWPPTNQVCEVSMLPDASVCFDSMPGKRVACCSVIVAILPSFCSFLLMVDEVVNKEKTSQARPCDHEGTFTLMNMCSDY